MTLRTNTQSSVAQFHNRPPLYFIMKYIILNICKPSYYSNTIMHIRYTCGIMPECPHLCDVSLRVGIEICLKF